MNTLRSLARLAAAKFIAVTSCGYGFKGGPTWGLLLWRCPQYKIEKSLYKIIFHRSDLNFSGWKKTRKCLNKYFYWHRSRMWALPSSVLCFHWCRVTFLFLGMTQFAFGKSSSLFAITAYVLYAVRFNIISLNNGHLFLGIYTVLFSFFKLYFVAH